MSTSNANILDTPIEFLKGVGPKKAEALQKELRVFTFRDLLFHFPFRYEDRTKFALAKEVSQEGQIVQLKASIVSVEVIKGKRSSRTKAIAKDASGFINLIWFQGGKWIAENLKTDYEYVIYGKVSLYGSRKTIAHPELSLANEVSTLNKTYIPVYSSTEKLDRIGLDSKARRKLCQGILGKLTENQFQDNLSEYIISKLKLCSRYQAINWIHFQETEEQRQAAINRLKFEELFFMQLRMLQNKELRKKKLVGAVFESVGEHFLNFYNKILPFELTGAQKRVIKEVRADMGKGFQMNRLLQGDVGSGKTIVAILSMLIAIDNGYQCCLMAPTQILAQQHYTGILEMLEGTGLQVNFLTGSIKSKNRRQTLDALKNGTLDIIIGTHALIEDKVIFDNLGLAIIDEQHRFGVVQRAKLWNKNSRVAPHVLVMTATPIPRTLAMTVYGDLDVSIIDELPPGRKDIKTIHRYDPHRPKLIQFMREQIKLGRQIYVVYPLIEESAKLDLANLDMGYEYLRQYFMPPDFQISVVHGRMKAKEKDFEMQRFVERKTQIMVATTVIEVGVNVPNASVMVIENTERFGLSQLHQLRGRVGRGAEQSYCILMSSYKLSKMGKERINTMVRTNNGFEIAEADLKLRGPGDMMGTQQSGALDFRLVNIIQDNKILLVARHIAEQIIEEDPYFQNLENASLNKYLAKVRLRDRNWGRIS